MNLRTSGLFTRLSDVHFSNEGEWNWYLCAMSENDMSGFGKFRDLDPGDYYYSDEGFIVFTEQYHKKRGYCCKSGCRHCPYGYNKKTGRIEK